MRSKRARKQEHGKEHGIARLPRRRSNDPMREGSKRAWEIGKKLNRSTRGRVNSPTQEASKKEAR